jgi:hypothetical protein
MKAIAKCPECGEIVTTDCRACIDAGIMDCEDGGSNHNCNVENVKWKKIPETEQELKEVEEENV